MQPDDREGLRRDDLIAALNTHRNVEVVVVFDGARLPVTGVAYAFQHPDRLGNDQLEIHVHDLDVFQVACRYSDEVDEDLLPGLVGDLRELWDDYRQSTRGRGGYTPDFYTWTTWMLRTLYRQNALQVPLPADVDREAVCTCMRTTVPHKPQQDHRCLYRIRPQ